jgi:TRAP-type mannitol/chloroaromatic compound transport system permease small subunit
LTLLLRLSSAIDALNEAVARLAAWLVVVAVVVSAGNAVSRKLFSLSSNAWLELQWYLFGAVFLLGAAWTLKRDEHVRVDVLAGRLSPRGRHRLDLFGHAVFLLPFAALHVATSVPFFLSSWRTGEVSANAGGLAIWPAKLLVLLGFCLLLAQGLSELVKRFASLRGVSDGDGPAGGRGEADE